MKVVLLNYNGGNVQSVRYALNRLGIEPLITDDKEDVKNSDKLIIPGVGEAKSAMTYLTERELDNLIPRLKQPVLGICLGMQLMCRFSEEGNTDCLGIFNQNVKKFKGNSKVPQIGWNTIYNLHGPLFKNVDDQEFQYFVHSYYIEKNENTIAATNYINEYSSALQKNNFYGVQFHPEKSSKAGEQILKNFLEL